MTIVRCPNCKKIFAVQPGAGNQDVVHNCDSGRDILDYEDILKLDDPNWNFQGIENKASVLARVEGYDVSDETDRGNRASTHRTRKYEHYMELGDNFVIR